jgi:hypothetical protein
MHAIVDKTVTTQRMSAMLAKRVNEASKVSSNDPPVDDGGV